jgi:hypothetical protein
MKTKLHPIFIALAWLALWTFNAQLSTAEAQGTAFTYQGRLNDGANPANGSYDLTFSLFNASTGGSQVGSTLTNTAVGVADGLFAVTLDFGAVFNGTAYWLQIGVRTNGGSAFTSLSPLQELTPTPYAIYSPNAGTAVSAGTASTVASGSVSSASIQAGSIMASNLNLGSVSSALGGSFWSLAGNAGTGGTGFLGTADGQPLDLGANGARALRLQYARSSLLGLNSQTSVNVIGGYAANYVAGGVVGGTIAGGGDRFTSGILGLGGIDYSNSVIGSFGTVGGGFSNTAGPDGTVPGGYDNTASGTASFAAGAYANATNNYSFVWSDGTTLYSSGDNCFDIHAGGGIHVNNSDIFLDGGNDRNAGLSYRASTLIPVGTVQAVQGPFLYGFDGGVLGTLGPEAYALQWDWHGNVWVSNNLATTSLNVDRNGLNIGNVNANSLTFGISSGEGVCSKRSGTNPYDLEFWTDFNNRMTILQGGNVGIGTTDPTETLEINGTSRLDDNDMYLRAGTDRNHGLGYRASITGISTDGPFLYGWNGGALGTSGPDTIALKWDYLGNVWASNNLSTATLTIRGGSDVAEPFPVTGCQVEPGTVMVIDEANPGQLRRSTQAYDTRVAGIISGAGGIQPGLSLQQDGVLAQGQKVALSGRVYVQADASTGAIRPGDLLTTSDVPGRAMKVSDHARAQGAILGKAMTGLKEGKGLVLVLVTLQ